MSFAGFDFLWSFARLSVCLFGMEVLNRWHQELVHALVCELFHGWGADLLQLIGYKVPKVQWGRMSNI